MSSEQLQAQSQAGQVASNIQLEIYRLIKPGVNLLQINELVVNELKKARMTPAFLGFEGYPAACCLSVNEEVVHAIPRSRVLEKGDIVSVDIGIKNKGWIVDMARTFPVGNISQRDHQLLQGTARALDLAIITAGTDPRPSAIGKTIEQTITQNQLWVIRDLAGHGVGRSLQEPPSIYNHNNHDKKRLPEGKTIAIEPIIAAKECQLVVMADGWTISTADSTNAAQFEDTVMITDDGALNLTRFTEEKIYWPSLESWQL